MRGIEVGIGPPNGCTPGIRDALRGSKHCAVAGLGARLFASPLALSTEKKPPTAGSQVVSFRAPLSADPQNPPQSASRAIAAPRWHSSRNAPKPAVSQLLPQAT